MPVTLNAFSARAGVGFAISLLNIGSGIIIGPRVSTSMMIGATIGWVLFPPWLLRHGLIAPDAKRVDILLTVMWPAVGMMVAAGIAGLALRWRVLLKSFQGLTAARAEAYDLPLRWVWTGCAASAAVLLVVQRLFFGTPVWQSVIAIFLALPLGLVALRVLGETNWGPISTMVNLVQAIFGVLAPGDLRASMVSSGITGAVAAESEGLMQDFKAGWMIGSTPRILTYMQLLAVPVGALALAVMYPLIRDTYGIIGEHAQLLSPTSQRWVGFAKVVTRELAPGGTAHGRRGRANRVDEGLVRLGCGDRGADHAAGAAPGMAPVRPLAHRDGHCGADPVQRGDRHLHGRNAGRGMEAGGAAEPGAVLDTGGIGTHRGRGPRRGGHSAAGHAGAAQAMTPREIPR